MADASKHLSLSGNFIADLKSLVSVVQTRRIKVFAYGFVLAFVACTVFLAFNPTSNSSPFFNRFFTSPSSSSSTSTSSSSSQLSSFLSFFFPQSTSSSGAVSDAKDRNFTYPLTQQSSRNGAESSPSVAQIRNAAKPSNSSSSPANLKQVAQSSSRLNRHNGSISASDARNAAKDPNFSARNVTATSPNASAVNLTASLQKLNVTGAGGEASKKKSFAPAGKAQNATASPNLPALSPHKRNATGVSGGEKKKRSTSVGNVGNVSVSSKNATSSSSSAKKGSMQRLKSNEMVESLKKCDIFEGRWVRDDSYPLYKEGSCPHIDEPFNCFLNGRPDLQFQKLRWQPNACNIPRLNGTDMLERLRGKRLVLVGDSLNRNMWESLVCVLRNSVEDKSKVFEASGRREFRTEGSYSFVFKDYNCSIEFFRSPFLVQEWETPEPNGSTKETLRLDLVEGSSSKYKNADVIIFNTGHWWTHEKTSKGRDYYQEGSHIYGELNVREAFRKALTTWARWVDANVNPRKTHVFFRGYSASHFSGGWWNSGGACDRETEPIKNETYLGAYPPKMRILESVMKGMKTPINYLNITRMTDYRKDAHPSIYRKQNLTDEERRAPERYQDCSHWCLPGVPDVWNQLLYAQLVVKLQN